MAAHNVYSCLWLHLANSPHALTAITATVPKNQHAAKPSYNCCLRQLLVNGLFTDFLEATLNTLHAPKCSYKQIISLNKVRHAVALGHLFTFWPLKSSLLTGASAAQYPGKSEAGHKKNTGDKCWSAGWQQWRYNTDLCTALKWSPVLSCNLQLTSFTATLSCLCFYVWYLTCAIESVTSNDSATAALSGPIHDRKPGNETLKTKAIPVMAFQRKWHKHRSRIRTVIKQGDRNRYTGTLKYSQSHKWALCAVKRLSCSANYQDIHSYPP